MKKNKKARKRKTSFRFLDKIIIFEWSVFLIFCLLAFAGIKYLDSAKNGTGGFVRNSVKVFPTSFPSVQPSISPKPYEAPQIQYKTVQSTPADTTPWGVAKQLDTHTWTLRVGQDDRMATAGEILDALNLYRQQHGSAPIAWDNNLAAFAKERADYFNQIGQLDGHAGFDAYVTNGDNVRQKLNFYHLGENSSIGYRLLAVHLIEWVYAADAGHNMNQLNPVWTHVGIGVSGTATDLIFGE